jgi:hypothetical protein
MAGVRLGWWGWGKCEDGPGGGWCGTGSGLRLGLRGGLCCVSVERFLAGSTWKSRSSLM